MNNTVQKKLHDIERISTEIANNFQTDMMSDDIVDKMIQRGEWIITLIESSNDVDKQEILQSLITIRDKEQQLLTPYRQTLHEMQETLIKMKQTTAYLN